MAQPVGRCRMWRVVLAIAVLATAAGTEPASAQFYGGYGGYYEPAPSWQRSPTRQQWRYEQNDDDWNYGEDARRQSETRSGGARPFIAATAPPIVAFRNSYPTNSIVIDSEGRMLYYILSSTEAYQYPISVGREGFAWSGNERISRKQAWPDWVPPKEMIARDPRVPDRMTGGIDNPLGAMALYLGNTLYRIHGTNDPKSIGRAASSGCFRMMNEHVLHLASLVSIGTPVAVVRRLPGQAVASSRRTATPRVAVRNADTYGSRRAPRQRQEDPFDEPPAGYGRYEPYGRDDRYAPPSGYGGYDGWYDGY